MIAHETTALRRTNVVSEAMKAQPNPAVLAIIARATGKGFPTPNGYIAAIANVHKALQRLAYTYL